MQTLQAEQEKPGWLVLLEPTCPLRTAEDVRDCLRLLADGECHSVATFKEAELNPHRAWRIVEGVPAGVHCRRGSVAAPAKAAEGVPELNGAVMFSRRRFARQETMSVLLGKSAAVIMPRERSHDIDDIVDFRVG